MAQPVNLGSKAPEATTPFAVTQVATFNLPWRIAFLPDGRMLITEKVGPLFVVTQSGEKTQVNGVPTVVWSGQGGMMGVYLSPTYAKDQNIYLTYAEPGIGSDGDKASSLALARAKLVMGKDGSARLDGLKVIWRDPLKGQGGQFGAAVAFSPDGKYLFLSSGDRMRMTPAQDPDQVVGKILRLTLDGKPAPGNPGAGKTGAKEIKLINPARDTVAVKTAPVVRTYTFSGPNTAPAEIWSSGHRTPYGLAFAPDGGLWEVEHGPKGGDELNLILPTKNYGWPEVCYCVNYNDVPNPSHDTRPEFEKPKIYWQPVIAPGNITFYKGAMFPQLEGSALISGLGSKTINRIVIKGDTATPAERWNVDKRVRDVEVAPDGAIWMIEDANPGGLFRLTPK
jgi:glucose/arabinose dehydrogenase